MNLEKEYLKGNNLKMTVARTFTVVVIIICLFYSIGISNWATNSSPEPTDNLYYADPDMVQNSVYDPHGVLKNSTLNALRNANLTLMEKYNVRALVALVDHTDLAGRDAETYAVDLFESEYLGWNDTLMVITATGDYWVEFGRNIYTHAISDKVYSDSYFDSLDLYLSSGDYDTAATFHIDRTTEMYFNYDNLTSNLSYTNYGNSSGYYLIGNLFGAVFMMAVAIIVIAVIAVSAGKGRGYKYVTYYPHRRKFRPNYYNFYRHQNRYNHVHHTRSGFWGPGSANKWNSPNNNSSWNSGSSGRNNSGGGFGGHGQSKWTSNSKPSSGGRSNSGGGFGRSSGSSGRSGGGFGGGGRGSSGGGFGRKK